jgi:hypothetical protein
MRCGCFMIASLNSGCYCDPEAGRETGFEGE